MPLEPDKANQTAARVPDELGSTLPRMLRQAAKSQIVMNAQRINHGVIPDLRKLEAESDFYDIEADDPEIAVPRITLVAAAITTGSRLAPQLPGSARTGRDRFRRMRHSVRRGFPNSRLCSPTKMLVALTS
ncbi:MAG: hypothetical protein WA441_04295 [Methyloceanibacter sp.]